MAQGVSIRSNRCDLCKLKFNFKWDKQEVWLFKCDHIFHTSCIQATSGQCAVCFNELEAFCKWPQEAKCPRSVYLLTVSVVCV